MSLLLVLFAWGKRNAYVCVSCSGTAERSVKWKQDEDGFVLIVGGQYGCITGGACGCDHRLGLLSVAGWSALPSGCIRCLGFSQLQAVAAALFLQGVKPDGIVLLERGRQQEGFWSAEISLL